MIFTALSVNPAVNVGSRGMGSATCDSHLPVKEVMRQELIEGPQDDLSGVRCVRLALERRFSPPKWSHRTCRLATTFERVRELGGSIIHPGDRWAVRRDSEGSPFALAAATGTGE